MNGQPPVIVQQAAPKRTGWIVYAVIVSFLFFVSVLANFGLLALVAGVGAGEARVGARHAYYEENYVEGEEDSRNKIAVISLTGVISDTSDGYGREGGMVESLKEQLRQAIEDKRVKAIILRINSPGGEVVASDTIYQAVVDARKLKPVVASIGALGASGGYYVAVGADYIIAKDVSITGSIGVIMQSFTVADLMTKIGVKSYVFKSGRYKDVLNPAREPTEDEKQLVQDLIMQVYDKFVGIVAKERNMNVDDLKSGLADGRILSGLQAKDAGFIDQIGSFKDAVAKAKELGHVKEARVVRYTPPFSLRQLLRFAGENDRAKIQIEVSPNQIKLESGKLYLLPPYLFQ